MCFIKFRFFSRRIDGKYIKLDDDHQKTKYNLECWLQPFFRFFLQNPYDIQTFYDIKLDLFKVSNHNAEGFFTGKQENAHH